MDKPPGKCVMNLSLCVCVCVALMVISIIKVLSFCFPINTFPMIQCIIQFLLGWPTQIHRRRTRHTKHTPGEPRKSQRPAARKSHEHLRRWAEKVRFLSSRERNPTHFILLTQLGRNSVLCVCLCVQHMCLTWT